MRLDGAPFGEGGRIKIKHYRALAQGFLQRKRKGFSSQRGIQGKGRRGIARLQLRMRRGRNQAGKGQRGGCRQGGTMKISHDYSFKLSMLARNAGRQERSEEPTSELQSQHS